MPPWLAQYLERTRQPWACLLFVAPLLIAYEAGLLLIRATSEDRTGADAWLRSALVWGGVTLPLAAPLVLAGGLLLWGWLTPRQSFRDPLGAWIGMAIESVVFAGLLLGLVQVLMPLLTRVGGVFTLDVSPGSPELAWAMIVRFLGAGIYEETIFRLVGFSLLRLLFLAGDLRSGWASLLAAVGSAIAFAAAHHFGSGQTRIDAVIVLYQFLAGLYFAALFCTRGYGIAVGAHAGFDVLVGLILR